MDFGKNYIKTIKSCSDELKNINDRKNKIIQEKKNTEEKLYHWMKKLQINEYEGIKIDKIKPKEKVKIVRKKKKEKEEDMKRLLREEGIPDVEELYERLKLAQKPKSVTI